jgi:siroheme synthase (precorrin-2 oxidase/ferrochelatase)
MVTDSPGEGNCTSMATHRAGGLVIGVSAGGVPNAAARIRDAASVRFDARYAAAVDALRILRGRLAGSGDSEAWTLAVRDLLGADFCGLVESGEFSGRAARWASDERSVPHTGDIVWR